MLKLSNPRLVHATNGSNVADLSTFQHVLSFNHNQLWQSQLNHNYWLLKNFELDRITRIVSDDFQVICKCGQLFHNLQASYKLCNACIEAAGKCDECKCSLAEKEVCEIKDHDSIDDQRLCRSCFDKSYCNCDECGDLYEKLGNDVTEIDGDYYCDSCHDDKFSQCYHCNEWVNSGDTQEHNYRTYCKSCFNDYFTYCDECQEYDNYDDVSYLENYEIDVCGECRQNNFTWCQIHDRYERDEDRCSDDDDDEDSSSIHDHSYKPKPQFHGTGPLFLGFELEVENCGDSNSSEVAKSLSDVLPVYCKHDSSLNNGFEIVSHPLTFEFIKELNLTPIFKLAHDGFKSYDTTTCGMHVHLSAKAFTTLHLYKFMKFMFENPTFVYKISQRKSQANLKQWASLDAEGKSIAYDVKTKSNGKRNRYSAVNLNNHSTVEIRIFKGSLKKTSFRKNIEFCHALYAYTKDISIQAVSVQGFIEFVNQGRKVYKNLFEFITNK